MNAEYFWCNQQSDLLRANLARLIRYSLALIPYLQLNKYFETSILHVFNKIHLYPNNMFQAYKQTSEIITNFTYLISFSISFSLSLPEKRYILYIEG